MTAPQHGPCPAKILSRLNSNGRFLAAEQSAMIAPGSNLSNTQVQRDSMGSHIILRTQKGPCGETPAACYLPVESLCYDWRLDVLWT
jgi:hypothetical protein